MGDEHKPAEARTESDDLSDADKLHLLKKMLDLLPDFVYTHDSDLRFHFANRAAAEYFGLKNGDDIVGSRLRDLEPNKEQALIFERICREVMASGVPRVSDRLPLELADGSTRFLRQHDVPFNHPITGQSMLFGLSRDVTDEVDLEKERLKIVELERDIALARQIQRSTWPKASPDVTGLHFAAFSEPAVFVGGDLYDWWMLEDERVQVCLGDATGHGIGAALMASECRAYARALLTGTHPIAPTMSRLSKLLLQHGAKGRFVTFLSVTLDPETGNGSLYSCGHGPTLLLRRNGEIEELPTHTLPLGLGDLAESSDPQDATLFHLDPGDALLLFTDGAYELRRSNGEQLGTKRLKTIATEYADLPATEIMTKLKERMETFRGDVAADDDTTLVVISKDS